MDSYWKTVRAATSADIDDARSRLLIAIAASGFTNHRQLGDDAWSFVRWSWLMGLATRHEWQVSLTHDSPHTVISVRCGLLPHVLYYLGMLVGFAIAMTATIALADRPDRTWLTGVIAVGFALPVLHAFAIRLEAAALEKRLWPQLAPLKPFAWSHTVVRNLNFAYGRDRVLPSRELGSDTL